MECKKCGNDEIEDFDYGIEGDIRTKDSKMYIICLSCDNRVYNPSREMLKELEE